ncbi:uncharacterized protein HMPREF1120_07617 [Exophiala dermatitidis NIH/UT8656]|uniref:Uncharacterized protein n=1 Tax=Exophiala dermatitidis (strain ATCC 34100 / CBS 525.76 / NIH/UT8656) TaxID=858893 RepID=H6C7D6_EXODN|nr:uncharacterized protein HMPREF1120_07617 [Exophiala dermatitidis NIH/UT8656]EHY59632.1 hypothetical protein HMPREF1120_07617 [Exophiala dermatitidis NIH/UT8656]
MAEKHAGLSVVCIRCGAGKHQTATVRDMKSHPQRIQTRLSLKDDIQVANIDNANIVMQARGEKGAAYGFRHVKKEFTTKGARWEESILISQRILKTMTTTMRIPEVIDDYSVRISSRAQSRTRRVVRRQDSDAYSGNPPQAEYYVERYEYIQQPPSRHHQRGYSPQQGPALPNVRDTSLPAHNRSQHPQQEDKDTHDQGAYDRLRSRSIPRGRLRSRENDFHYGGVYDGSPPYYTQLTPNKEIADPSQGRHGRRLVYAPSPPPARSSSLGYLADPEAEEKEQQHIRIGGSRRRRSRSRPLDVESSELRILRPGDELTVVERYAPRPNQDYERYDHEGIRVRVREI